jgi:hypothetical protein
MFQFTVQEPTAKRTLLQLLDFAEQVLEHDVKIDGKTLDDAELEDATVEDAFEELRSKIHTLMETVDYLVD